MCPRKCQSFDNIDVMKKVIYYCISDLAADIDVQLRVRVANLVAFSVTIDVNTDTTEISWLSKGLMQV